MSDTVSARTGSDVLLQLAERCEREGPTIDLTCAIALALGWREVEHDNHIRYVDPDGEMWWIGDVAWLRSLDAAVTLVPSEAESWLVAKGRVTPDEPIWGAGVYSDEGAEHEIGAAETNASAAACLCAAALRARAALLETKT